MLNLSSKDEENLNYFFSVRPYLLTFFAGVKCCSFCKKKSLKHFPRFPFVRSYQLLILSSLMVVFHLFSFFTFLFSWCSRIELHVLHVILFKTRINVKYRINGIWKIVCLNCYSTNILINWLGKNVKIMNSKCKLSMKDMYFIFSVH